MKSDPRKPDPHEMCCRSPPLAQPRACPALLSLFQKIPGNPLLTAEQPVRSDTVCISKSVPRRDLRGSVLIKPYSSQAKHGGNRQLTKQHAIRSSSPNQNAVSDRTAPPTYDYPKKETVDVYLSSFNNIRVNNIWLNQEESTFSAGRRKAYPR
ncbi:hypothetical protein GRJ2_001595800 [Grus japonensis]|uniref:Uncharacterized protein n=1 Tax=Grus japonensis TaxID=30415 RepID=A0ABC9X0S7_GRUJA